MSKNKFTKAPLSPLEKEKKAEEFLNFLPTRVEKSNVTEEKKQVRVFKKEEVKASIWAQDKAIRI